MGLLILLSGCSGEAKKPDKAIEYFDLGEFINSEISRMTSQNPLVEKKVTMNGEVQEKQAKIENWKRELSVFLDSDINKPALYGKYQVDTLLDSNGIRSISYTAKAKNLKTRFIRVRYQSSGSPDKIEINSASKNLLYQFDQALTYSPAEGYSISAKQIIKFLGEDDFSVETRFL